MRDVLRIEGQTRAAVVLIDAWGTLWLHGCPVADPGRHPHMLRHVRRSRGLFGVWVERWDLRDLGVRLRHVVDARGEDWWDVDPGV